MPRKLRLGELVRVNIDPMGSQYKINAVVLKKTRGNVTVAIEAPDSSPKYISETFSIDQAEPLTADMVPEDEYNEAKEFQNEMDKEVDSEGLKVMGRTNGGRKKTRKKRKSKSRSKKRTYRK